MAKKKPTTTKSSTATKAKKSSAPKPAKKPLPKQHDHKHAIDDEDEEEIELDDTERKAVDLVLDSEDLRNALETEVNTVVTQAVRKICKAHGATLSVAQAQNVAMMLFGD
jgi:acetyl-CoA carboxylase carboxyltransferase component